MRSKLSPDYHPSEDEAFMNPRQLEYFRQKLLRWRAELLAESSETLQHLKDESLLKPDITDRASLETERAIELRTRDRERKLIAKIDEALGRIKDGTYGYCEETSEPIGHLPADRSGHHKGAPQAIHSGIMRVEHPQLARLAQIDRRKREPHALPQRRQPRPHGNQQQQGDANRRQHPFQEGDAPTVAIVRGSAGPGGGNPCRGVGQDRRFRLALLTLLRAISDAAETERR